MYTAVRIKKTYGTHLECVIKYYTILNILSSLGLSKGEINILSFTCVYGQISGSTARGEFVKTFDMARRSLDNAVLSLLKRGFLIREDKKIILNKQLHIEFESLLLRIDIHEAS